MDSARPANLPGASTSVAAAADVADEAGIASVGAVLPPATPALEPDADPARGRTLEPDADPARRRTLEADVDPARGRTLEPDADLARRRMLALPVVEPDADPARWRMLALLAAAVLLGMSLWFGASAVAPQLAGPWGGGVSKVAWLTTVVQLGFVAGTAGVALFNLADLVAARRLFAVAAVLGALANAALLAAPGYGAALACRFATGFFLAGVYPPAMKMVATWFRARRGLAIGTVVGALTVGKATPYLVHALRGAGVAAVVLTASAGALVAAALVHIAYRDGPYPFAARPFSWGLTGEVFRLRRYRLATAGYLGHMFELYSFWTWIPAFLAASAARHGGSSPAQVSLAAFGTIAIGGAGCVWGGLVADRRGREPLVILALAASGSCSLVIGLLFGGNLLLVTLLAWVWGFFVIADSAQFSALVTEAVPAHAVGTALTLQTALGFLLTTVSIQLVPPLAARLGWPLAFPVLALGPAAGIAAIRRLSRRGNGPGRP